MHVVSALCWNYLPIPDPGAKTEAVLSQPLLLLVNAACLQSTFSPLSVQQPPPRHACYDHRTPGLTQPQSYCTSTLSLLTPHLSWKTSSHLEKLLKTSLKNMLDPPCTSSSAVRTECSSALLCLPHTALREHPGLPGLHCTSRPCRLLASCVFLYSHLMQPVSFLVVSSIDQPPGYSVMSGLVCLSQRPPATILSSQVSSVPLPCQHVSPPFNFSNPYSWPLRGVIWN